MNIFKFLNLKGGFVNQPTMNQIRKESLELKAKSNKLDLRRSLLAQGRKCTIEETDTEFIIREID